MQFTNDIKKGYIITKKKMHLTFPEAYNFLTQIENLNSKGFHIGTYLNLNLYYKTKFILHVGLVRDYLDIAGKPNGTLKKGTTDDSSSFMNNLIHKIASFKRDTNNTIEIFSDNNASFWVNKTRKSKTVFKIILDSLLEYSEKEGSFDLNNELHNIVNGIQLSNEPDYSSYEKLLEGIQKTITATVYERNLKARAVCLKHWKYNCVVCGFNFKNTYGEFGKNFIHVHHINQISSLKKEYEIDPINDLRPVCPNCHSMIHRNNKPLTIDELKNMLKKAASKK